MKRLNPAYATALSLALGLLSSTTVGSAAASSQPLRPVLFTDVRFTDQFWASRIATNHVATIPHLLRELDQQGSLGAFRIVAGEHGGNYRGYMWGDSDVYKTLEGITAALALRPDPSLAAQQHSIIATIIEAQAPDGYLFPHLQITEPEYRHFADETSRTCESYSLGHLVEAGAEHYRLTGRTNLLVVARRAAELVRRAHARGDLPVSGHPEIELALVKLSQVTGETNWRQLAASFVTNASHVTSAWSQGKAPLAGVEAHGHAVAMLYLYCAATDVARLQRDKELLELLCRKWTNVVGQKLYLTGGLGHSAHGEGFGGAYDLPNELAYSETCAAIANVFWQERLFLATGSAAFIDVLERSLYNNLLAGISFSGDRFFYVNPLATDGNRKFNQGTAERFAWTGCPCCPVNLVRFIPRIGDYMYATAGNEVYVKLYADSEANLKLPAGPLKLRQHTQYPWEGTIRVEIKEAPAQTVRLGLRIPGWARGEPVPTDLYRYSVPQTAGAPQFFVNGGPAEAQFERGFAFFGRTWRSGDSLELQLPMPVRRVLAHEKVLADNQRVAVERGPLVYCLESHDNPGLFPELCLPDAAEFEVVPEALPLGGARMIEASWSRTALPQDRPAHRERLRFVPYYAWNNRGVGAMEVWIPAAQPSP